MKMETPQALIQVNKGQRLRGYKVKSANEHKNLGNQELPTQIQCIQARKMSPWLSMPTAHRQEDLELMERTYL